MSHYKQLKQSDIAKLRKFYHGKQEYTCPIMNQEFEDSEMVLDHKHRKKSEKIGNDDCGFVRGVINRYANSMEGKITNAYIRYGLHKFNITLPNFLRNLADYIENPPLVHLQLVHPSEKEKQPKLMKRSYSDLRKWFHMHYRGRKKLPDYPKSGKVTKPLQVLFEESGLEPKFYKK